MPLSPEVQAFMVENHHGVLSTFRKNGAAQLSIVSCGLFRNGVAFTTTFDRAKLKNLYRDPRCSLLVSKPDWWGYVVLEGVAVIMDPDNTEAEELRLAFQEVYRVASGAEHPNWDEYDQAMRDQGRAVVIAVPDHVYGTAV